MIFICPKKSFLILSYICVYIFGFSARAREETAKLHFFHYQGQSKRDVGLELEELEEAAELTLQEERLTTAEEDGGKKEDGASQDPLELICRNIQDKLTLASHDSDDSEDDSSDSENDSSDSDDSSDSEQDEKQPVGEPVH